MYCPICKNNEHVDYNLHSDGFASGIMECGICGTVWSFNHDTIKVVHDPQGESFLGEVPGYYYCFAA